MKMGLHHWGLKSLNAIRPILVVFAAIGTVVSGEPGYLKFCGEEHKEVIYSTSCRKGLWLNVPVSPGCICATGVWAISNGFCDRHASIIVGQDHCFHVGFDVRAVKFIGNPNDPFEPSVHTAQDDVDVINEVPETGLSTNIESDRSLVIGINPDRPVERADRETCLLVHMKNKWKPVHIYANPSRSTSNWFYSSELQCSVTADYTYHVGFGEMFRDHKVLTKDVIGRDCYQQCPDPVSIPAVMRLGRGASEGGESLTVGDSPPALNSSTKPIGKPRTVDEKIVPFNMTLDGEDGLLGPTASHAPLIRQGNERQTKQELLRAQQAERAKVMIELDDYHREVNEQTLRMMHAQISQLLLNSNTSEISTREYAYFQKARVVVERLCPVEFVPVKLLRGLMRMFKQLLWESLEDHPHNQVGDDSQFDRIMTVLDNCTGNTTDTERFLFYNYTGAYNFTDKNESFPDWPKPEQCPEPLIYGVYGKNQNSRAPTYGTYTILHNVTGGFKPYLKFNVSLVDYVIETAWKTVMIGHYHCSKSFNDSTAGDFASFFHQIELLFNDRIVKRWYDPINVNKTFEILQLIFPTYDLKKFAFGLDVCLFASQQYTDFGYNSKWIQRPKIPFTGNELSPSLFPIPGSGLPVSTNDYAPKIGRKKRSTHTNSKWNGKARCMRDYLDPVTRYGYIPKPGCKIAAEDRTNKGKKEFA